MRKRNAYMRGVPVQDKNFRKVRIHRERPAGVAWAAALAITMLMVYLASCITPKSFMAESAIAKPRVTREICLEPLEMYMVSIYDCASGEEARLLASGYTGKGAAGYIYEGNGGWQVLGAAYAEERDARRIAERLFSEEKITARVIRMSAPKIDMRITAPDVQIDAVVEADDFLRKQTVQMGNIARQLDNNEIGAGTACTLCAAAATGAYAHSAMLEKIPGAEGNVLCAGLVKSLGTAGKMLEIIAGAGGENASVLSGMLRCAQIDIFIGMADLQQKLASA